MAISRSSIAQRVDRFLREVARIPDGDPEFCATTDLFDGGYLDSVAVVQLVSYLETEFGCVVSDEDVFDARFSTVEGISALVEERLGVRLS